MSTAPRPPDSSAPARLDPDIDPSVLDEAIQVLNKIEDGNIYVRLSATQARTLLATMRTLQAAARLTVMR